MVELKVLAFFLIVFVVVLVAWYSVVSCRKPAGLVKPCPFCGSVPFLPDGYGSEYAIECDQCGQALALVRISDLMADHEKLSAEFKGMRYPEIYIERARKAAIKRWNKRN